MGQPKQDPSRALAPAVEKAVRLGMDLMRSARAAVPTDPVAERERQMVTEHRMALARRDAALRKHHFRVSGLKTEAVAAGSAAALGVAAMPVGGLGAWDIVLGVLAGGGAALSYRAHKRAKSAARRPPVVPIPPLPPARLRPGARGAGEAERVRMALLHLYDVIPNIATLHPQAGVELTRTVTEIEPLLRGQVERLAALDRIEWDMPGSAPAWAAAKGADEIATRLAAGARALEGLITAAAQLLAAPDLVNGVDDLLDPAIDSVQAFAYGLYAADQGRTR